MFGPRTICRSLSGAALLSVLLSVLLIAGCESAQDKAVDQAKKQAAATGQAQQVVSTDKNGVTTTTVVQPPQPGQTTQQITTTTTSSVNANAAGPQVASTNGAPQPATPASAPVITPVDVHIAAGTPLAIRINQTISVKHGYAGERFTGEINDPVIQDGSNNVIIPRGTHVEGVVVEAHRRGHFKGRSVLELRLVSMTLNGQVYRLDTQDFTRTKKGKGKRSAAFIGSGAGLGMLVGGIATGGVGLVVGGLVGAGGGTALGGLTGNRDIVIPAESVVNFRLADDLVVQPS